MPKKVKRKAAKKTTKKPKRHYGALGRGEFRIDRGFYINPRGGFRMRPITGSGFLGTVSKIAGFLQDYRNGN